MWGDVPGWIQAGVALALMMGGTIVYIHKRSEDDRKFSQDNLTSAKQEIEGKISGLKTEIAKSMEDESNSRKDEIHRVEESIRELRALPQQTAVLAKEVEHLGTRFADHKHSTDRAMDEIKHGMRSVDTKLDALGAQLRRRPRGPTQ